MIKNNVYYEFFASYTVPNPDQVGYWVDLGANSKGKIIKVYNPDIRQWVKVTDATSEDAVSPFIGSNGNWWIDNRDTGISAVGKNPYIGDNGRWYVYDPVSSKYINTGVVAKGRSAYDLAVENGFVGTEKEWLASLKKPAEDAAIAALAAAAKAEKAAEDTKDAITNANNAADNAQDAADRSNEIASNPPKIVNEEWYMYDELTQKYVSTGVKATGDAFIIVKTYPSVAAMVADYSNPEVGIGQFVMIDANDPENPEDSRLYLKGDTEWKFISDLSGMQGIQGLSAYQVAVQNGYIGTEVEWLASLSKASEDAAKEALAAKAQVEATEKLVKDAEALRVTAESDRVSAETTRVSNETTRDTNEDARKAAETSRVSAETSRVNVEASRVSAENARVTAETTRNTNEESRKSAETARVTAEASRVTVEQSRVTAEGTRVSQETARVNAEKIRDNAEKERINVETARVTAETGRASNEATRQANEAVRETQEAERETSTTAVITAVNEAKTAAETATTNATTAANNANDKAEFAQRKGELAFDAATHQPIVKNGTWWVYSIITDNLPVATSATQCYAVDLQGNLYDHTNLDTLTKDNFAGVVIIPRIYEYAMQRSAMFFDPRVNVWMFKPWGMGKEPVNLGVTSKYDGFQNTNIIQEYYGKDVDNAANYVRSLRTVFNTQCYLPAFEEFSDFGNVRVNINIILTKYGYSEVDKWDYITSTEEINKDDIIYTNRFSSTSYMKTKSDSLNVLPMSQFPNRVYVDTGIPATGDPGKSPKIQDGTWWIYNNVTDLYEDTGVAVNSQYELTKAKVENVLTGDITTHNHNTFYYTKEEVDAKASKSLVIDFVNDGTISGGTIEDIKAALNDGTEIIFINHSPDGDEYFKGFIIVDSTEPNTLRIFSPTNIRESSRSPLRIMNSDITITGNEWDVTNTNTTILDTENTLPYTPTDDYHPATKKYVDDSKSVVIPIYINSDKTVTFTVPAGTYQKVKNTIDNKLEVILDLVYDAGTVDEEHVFAKALMLQKEEPMIMMACSIGPNIIAFAISSEDIIEVTAINFFEEFLSKNNKQTYIPTEDYNPATKKYVDDKYVVVELPFAEAKDPTELVGTINGSYPEIVDKIINAYTNKTPLYAIITGINDLEKNPIPVTIDYVSTENIYLIFGSFLSIGLRKLNLVIECGKIDGKSVLAGELGIDYQANGYEIPNSIFNFTNSEFNDSLKKFIASIFEQDQLFTKLINTQTSYFYTLDYKNNYYLPVTVHRTPLGVDVPASLELYAIDGTNLYTTIVTKYGASDLVEVEVANKTEIVRVVQIEGVLKLTSDSTSAEIEEYLSKEDYWRFYKLSRENGIIFKHDKNIVKVWSADPSGDYSRLIFAYSNLRGYHVFDFRVKTADYVGQVSLLRTDYAYVTEEEGKGLSTNDYTNEDKAKLTSLPTSDEIDTKINTAVGSVYKVKGSVANYAALPTTNVVVGDVYNLTDTGANYVATSINPIVWDKLSETVDLSAYSTTAQADAKYIKNAGSNQVITTSENEASLIIRNTNNNPRINIQYENPEGRVISKGNFGSISRFLNGIGISNSTSGSAFALHDTTGLTYWEGNSNTPLKVWHEGNDGAGSGLDADLLDGKQGSEYMLATTADGKFLPLTGGDITGDVNFRKKITLTGETLLYRSPDKDVWFSSGYNQGDIIFQPKSNLYLHKDSNKYLVWNSGNDGAGSGLDADLLDGKHGSDYVLAESGKQLSTEDYTTAEKTKLASISTGAEVNVNADWDATSGDAQILNKPTILPEAPSDGKQYARKDGTWNEVVIPESYNPVMIPSAVFELIIDHLYNPTEIPVNDFMQAFGGDAKYQEVLTAIKNDDPVYFTANEPNVGTWKWLVDCTLLPPALAAVESAFLISGIPRMFGDQLNLTITIVKNVDGSYALTIETNLVIPQNDLYLDLTPLFKTDDSLVDTISQVTYDSIKKAYEKNIAIGKMNFDSQPRNLSIQVFAQPDGYVITCSMPIVIFGGIITKYITIFVGQDLIVSGNIVETGIELSGDSDMFLSANGTYRRPITTSTNAPTAADGLDGDLWIQYTT